MVPVGVDASSVDEEGLVCLIRVPAQRRPQQLDPVLEKFGLQLCQEHIFDQLFSCDSGSLRPGIL